MLHPLALLRVAQPALEPACMSRESSEQSVLVLRLQRLLGPLELVQRLAGSRADSRSIPDALQTSQRRVVARCDLWSKWMVLEQCNDAGHDANGRVRRRHGRVAAHGVKPSRNADGALFLHGGHRQRNTDADWVLGRNYAVALVNNHGDAVRAVPLLEEAAQPLCTIRSAALLVVPVTEQHGAPRLPASLDQAFHRRKRRHEPGLGVIRATAPDRLVLQVDVTREGRVPPLARAPLAHRHHVLVRGKQQWLERRVRPLPGVQEAMPVHALEAQRTIHAWEGFLKPVAKRRECLLPPAAVLLRRRPVIADTGVNLNCLAQPLGRLPQRRSPNVAPSKSLLRVVLGFLRAHARLGGQAAERTPHLGLVVQRRAELREAEKRKHKQHAERCTQQQVVPRAAARGHRGLDVVLRECLIHTAFGTGWTKRSVPGVSTWIRPAVSRASTDRHRAIHSSSTKSVC